MIFDSHMHTIFSSDSEMKLEDAIKVSKAKDLGLIITEHIDLDYPLPNEFRCDVPKYLSAYNNSRSESLLLGIEIGMAMPTLEENEAIPKKYDFDMVIGSIHSVDGLDIYSSGNSLKLEEYEFYLRYYKNMLACVQSYKDFDTLGHIDYIYRYAPFTNPQINIEPYKDIVYEIMKTLISNEKSMEINTRRLHEKEAAKALFKVFEFYKSIGGKYVTIGSDAHSKDAIGSNFDVALDIVNSLDLQGVYFKERNIKYFESK